MSSWRSMVRSIDRRSLAYARASRSAASHKPIDSKPTPMRAWLMSSSIWRKPPPGWPTSSAGVRSKRSAAVADACWPIFSSRRSIVTRRSRRPSGPSRNARTRNIDNPSSPSSTVPVRAITK